MSFLSTIQTLLFVALSLGLYAQGAVIEGQITDETGDAMIGVIVQLEDGYESVSSDLDGRFRFSGLETGTYTLQFRMLGFEHQTQEVSVEAAQTTQVDVQLKAKLLHTDELIVTATLADEKTPMSYTDVKQEEIAERNLGIDMPLLLDQTPSVVTTSDAGGGIGYTGIRIRGTDPTRINVTINGIPLNDSESQGVFWVNMPDFASSVDNVQIQRGVGTSTNGAGAFGATVNLQTNQLKEKAYGELSNTYGSFNSRMHSARFGTGLLNGHWTLDGRLSHIKSDGYIDRSASNLRSYYFSGAYVGNNTAIRMNIFSGHEITQQAWYGTPKARLENDIQGMEDYIVNNGLSPAQAANLRKSDRRYNHYLYDNEVDNYQQSHYHLHISQHISDAIDFKGALFYTKGEGYYEQYQDKNAPFDDTKFSDYGLEDVTIGNDTVRKSDFIRRRWLDNDLYGMIYSFTYNTNKALRLTLGGGLSQYQGKHFGEIIWAEYASNSQKNHRYYDNDARKWDWNTYLKANYQLSNRLNLFADLQHRFISYSFLGFLQDKSKIQQEEQLHFFNPKVGATYEWSASHQAYASVAVANREPNRDDFVNSTPNNRPKSETLIDFEAGYNWRARNLRLGANIYYMSYQNQLVVTGALSDVGAAIRTNIDKSYRAGIEMYGTWRILPQLEWSANLTLSQNKIAEHTQFIDNFNDWSVNAVTFENTDIAFSPNIIGASTISYKPFAHAEIALFSKHVGKQFIDNSSSDARSLDAYWVHDLRLAYAIPEKLGLKNIEFNFLIRNIFNNEYSTKAWVYRFYSGSSYQSTDGYYPQAGTNFLAGLTLKF